MPNQEPMIKVQDVRFRYDPEQPKYAVDGVSLDIRRGEFVAVLGANGCGKSTLAKHFNAILLPEAGTVLVEGMDTRNEDHLYDVRQKVGMVFQNPDNQIVATIVEEDVAFAPENLGVPPEEIRTRIDEAMKLAGIYEKREAAPYKLSGGQKQRVAIARALANKPQVLLSDEATSALDPDATEAILNLLRDLNRKLGLTIVLITHEMAVIKSICQRVAVMENGRVVEEGDVYDIFAHPRAAITRKFVSSASALSKVDKLMEEGSTLVRPTANQKLVRLTFHKDCVGEHVISTVSRDFGVDINIVLANVEVIEDNPLGGMIALLGGEEKQVAAALNYLNENHVYTEVIADGSI